MWENDRCICLILALNIIIVPPYRNNTLLKKINVQSLAQTSNQPCSMAKLQNVLSEFDFLHDVDRQLSPLHLPSALPSTTVTPAHDPTTPPIPQQRPHVMMSSDVFHRPLLSMPPVILMGGGGNGGLSANSSFLSSMPASPIIEMPPSPAANQMMYVEFPDDEVDEVKGCDVHNIVEVRFEF